MSETLLWLDLETTGLEPRDNSILEVAAFTAPLDNPFTLTPLYESVLRYEGSQELLDPTVLEMHTKNGLLDECTRTDVTLFHAEEAILSRLPTNDHPFILAGSSVHFDHSFLRYWMHGFNKRISHRHYDVSAIKLFAQSLGMPKLPKAEAHRAAADVMESVAHAKAVAQWFEERLG